ncbi:ECF transporter S component, folate family [Acetitomaculum ruminis DSM 5522]|uniref:ECF transporter S component, folate family n=1 Tax=Acetitomaculum ruminis DSM 5522 TaxID=1120918 RepID=A0A1I0WM31_9FIRM|nr:folate family ECF transporter S component [Acetitomaculum ruminis]SFA89681.1 ECF transporter S component, folate family [Acetitomaculum ruminis DSM 5522]
MSKLKNTFTLTTAAMLLALGILLGLFKLPINQFIEIRFASLPICIGGALFGPGIAAVIGAFSDIGGFIVRPTGPYFPGFTISGIITGIIFGIFLYKKALTWKRVLLAQAVNTIVVNLLINSYWLTLLYGTKTYTALLIGRLPKELIMVPILTAMMVGIAKSMEHVKMSVHDKAHAK